MGKFLAVDEPSRCGGGPSGKRSPSLAAEDAYDLAQGARGPKPQPPPRKPYDDHAKS